jgi:hypothetical protein
MQPTIKIASDKRAEFALSVYENPGVVVRNALSMFREELSEKHRIDCQPKSDISGQLIIEEPCLATGDDQTFSLRTERDGEQWQLTVTGSGDRGILYGLCDVLDRIKSRDGDLWLPELNLTSSPSMKKRGTERHWKPSFSDKEGVEANLKLIRALARKRINTLLWIDDWISPGWYRFLDFRHYPPLHRPERNKQVAKAKECLRRIVAEAKAWGMEFYLSTTEFTVPESLTRIAPHLFHTNERGFPVLRFEHPETWQYYRAKIREMMETVPELAGIELWLGEAMDPFICHFDHPDEWPLHRQFLHIWEQTLAAMDEAGRSDATLVCPTFTHHRNGDAIFEPLCGKLPDRCEGRMKMQVEDYYRFNDPTKLAGRISPGREWIEMDPGGEHRGDWIGWINVHLGYLRERMRHYHERGVNQFICRVRGFSPGPYSKLIGDLDVLTGVQAIKYDAYFRWCWDIDLTIEEVWQQCKPEGYPDEMLQFYLLSEKVSDQTQNVGRCLINNNHSTFLASVEHYEYKMSLINTYANDTCQENSSILAPTVENLDLIVQEKAEAVAFAEQMQRILETCRERLPDKDYEILKQTLDYQEQCVRVWRYHTEAFFRYRLFALKTPGADFGELVAVCKKCQAEIHRLRPYDEEQADTAQALIGNLISLAWVQACKSQSHPKGILPDSQIENYRETLAEYK